jgi:signal transduction histidine kinase
MIQRKMPPLENDDLLFIRKDNDMVMTKINMLGKMLLINPCDTLYSLCWWKYRRISYRRAMRKNSIQKTRARILLVDDEPLIIDTMRTALEAARYAVSVAINGEMAIRAVESVHPDIILLDIVMPGMNGYETCRRLKLNKTTDEIPVIFLTTLTETFDKVLGFQCGASDYIIKSVDVDELLARIETHLSLYRLKRELRGLNEALEERVKSQTAELVRSNESLKSEIEERKSAERQVRELSRLVVRSQDEERRRIARDLHDSVAQTLLAAKMGLIESEHRIGGNTEELHRGVELVDRALQELKEIYGNLYPSMLRDLGLAAAIRWYAKHQLEMNRINVALDMEINEETSEELKVNIYRIIQELFSNIAKHSGADSVTVVLRLPDDDDILLIVEDNGIGFSIQEKAGRGFGLATIRQRCDHIGCIMEFESRQGDGVRIVIKKADNTGCRDNAPS